MSRYKAKLVTEGFTQRIGIDFHETFSLVMIHVTTKIVLNILLPNNWSLTQIDVNNFFLQGHLPEKVFMWQHPLLFCKSFFKHVCKIEKNYMWSTTSTTCMIYYLSSFLIKSGFRNSVLDKSLFILKKMEFMPLCWCIIMNWSWQKVMLNFLWNSLKPCLQDSRQET